MLFTKGESTTSAIEPLQQSNRKNVRSQCRRLLFSRGTRLAAFQKRKIELPDETTMTLLSAPDQGGYGLRFASGSTALRNARKDN